MNECQSCGQIFMESEACDCSFAVARRKINDLFNEGEIPEHWKLYELLYLACDVFAAGGLSKATLQLNDTTIISFCVKNSLLLVERKDTEKKTEAISL